jgi:glycosyltransferase involved in cell wall biosynthesis
MQQEVVFAGFVDQGDLPALFSGADIFLFPSRYEGFGLPPLEALSCGTAVIVSDAGSIPEVVGDGGIHLNPNHIEPWVRTIIRVLGDPQLKTHLEEKALERAAEFSWARTATMTSKVYETVVDQ